MSLIESYLKSCCELRRFCSRDGWIDNDSLRYSIIMETDDGVIVEIEFDELLMESPDCEATRVGCCGQLHLHTDRYGQITHAEVL
jgi:hypothetical protein